MTAEIGPAVREDLPAIVALLAQSELPEEGVGETLTTMLVSREEGHVVGSAAVELPGGSALLRSVAVSQGARGGGVGRRLVRLALALARDRGAEKAYLPTETADTYFPRFGFAPVERSEVPEDVRSSVEFVSACPASARAIAVEH